jgi:septum formation protein
VIGTLRVPAAPGLILASTSTYRRQLLERLRIPFTVMAPKVDEARRPGELALPRAERLALAKAQAVAQQHRAQPVIGADQVASCGGVILDKPGDAPAARAQLKAQSGRAVDFFSAVAVVHAERGFVDQFVDRTTVVIRTLSAAEIEAYLIADAPYDCAGSLRSEALGLSLCERIETIDPTGLIGLPLIRLAATLRSCGYALP